MSCPCKTRTCLRRSLFYLIQGTKGKGLYLNLFTYISRSAEKHGFLPLQFYKNHFINVILLDSQKKSEPAVELHHYLLKGAQPIVLLTIPQSYWGGESERFSPRRCSFTDLDQEKKLVFSSEPQPWLNTVVDQERLLAKQNHRGSVSGS